jgi:hypothetical protein
VGPATATKSSCHKGALSPVRSEAYSWAHAHKSESSWPLSPHINSPKSIGQLVCEEANCGVLLWSIT